MAVCVAGLLSAQIAGSEGLPPSAPETVALVVGWFILGFAFGIVLVAIGLILVILHQYRRHRPPRPHA